MANLGDDLKKAETKIVSEAETLVPSKASWIARHPILTTAIVLALGLLALALIF